MTKKTKTNKNKTKMRGKGDYSDVVLKMTDPSKRLEAKIDHLEQSINKKTPAVKTAASSIGRTLGNFINQGDLGALAGEQLAKFFGHGDYQVKTNSLMSAIAGVNSQNGPNPAKFSSKERGTRIVEREFLFDVRSGALVGGASSFTNTSFKINPTDSSTFPWLSTIANQFDQWEPNGIIFEFVSTSSSYNGVSQALGTVIMATDYDVYDPIYSTKQIMENSDYACSSRPSENLMHGVECDKNERPTPVLYTNSLADQNLQTLGNFQIATIGCSAANVTLGEVWISYDITLYKKQLAPISTLLPAFSAFGDVVFAGSIVPVNLPTTTISVNRFFIATHLPGVGTKFEFPFTRTSGRFIYTYAMTNQNADNVAPGTFVNCNAVTTRGIGLALGAIVTYVTIDVTGTGASFNVGLKTAINSTFWMSISEVNPALTV